MAFGRSVTSRMSPTFSVDPEGSLERRNRWEKTSHSHLVCAIHRFPVGLIQGRLDVCETGAIVVEHQIGGDVVREVGRGAAMIRSSQDT